MWASFLDFLYRPAFERCVPFFLVFSYRPGGPNAPKSFSETPRYCSKRPRASFFVSFNLQNRTAPGGVYSHYYGISRDAMCSTCAGHITCHAFTPPCDACIPSRAWYTSAWAQLLCSHPWWSVPLLPLRISRVMIGSSSGFCRP